CMLFFSFIAYWFVSSVVYFILYITPRIYSAIHFIKKVGLRSGGTILWNADSIINLLPKIESLTDQYGVGKFVEMSKLAGFSANTLIRYFLKFDFAPNLQKEEFNRIADEHMGLWSIEIARRDRSYKRPEGNPGLISILKNRLESEEWSQELIPNQYTSDM